MKLFPFYLIAFIEGSSLMSLQLLTSRIISTGYGVTLNVWAMLIVLTLAGLACGYFTGGYLTRSKNEVLASFRIVIVVATLFSFTLPFLGFIFIQTLLEFNPNFGLVLYCLLFVFPAVFMYGMFSPILIELLTQFDSHQKHGIVAGRIYSISTYGGITGTFLFGLYIIPIHGIKIACIIMGLAMLLAIIFFLKNIRTISVAS